jgi:hypothetical protein
MPPDYRSGLLARGRIASGASWFISRLVSTAKIVVIVGVGNVEVRSIVSHYARDALFSPQNPEASFAARERTKNGTAGLTHMLRPGAIRP